MKKQLLILFISFCTWSIVKAQNIEDGKKKFFAEQYTTAAQLFQQILTQKPDDAFTRYWLVRTYLVKGEAQEAKNTLAATPASIANDPFITIAKGAVSLQQGDTVQARSNFTTAIGTAKKKNPAIQLAVAAINIDLIHGDLNYAIDLLNEAGKKDKNDPELFTAMGDAYRKQYDGSQAFKAYQAAIDANKTYAVAYYKIGKIYQTQDNASVFTEYYDNALKYDSQLAPVYYQLYLWYYNKDVNKALEYLKQYIANSAADSKNDYLLTDMLYVSRKYEDAIKAGKQLINKEGMLVKPRIYKLIAYSYDGLNDYKNADNYMKLYFNKEADSNYVAKDFEMLGKIDEKNNLPAEAALAYEKAYHMEKDSSLQLNYVTKLASFYKAQKDHVKEAYWQGKLYGLKKNATNVDLFQWGVAAYNAKDYHMADSAFGIYERKYPEQTFGYYWNARSAAAIDTAMETGIAIPHYTHLIEIAGKDTANATNRKWLIQAYGYIAAYKVNKEKQYNEALTYYDKILALDPANNDAEHYKSILNKMIESASKNGTNN